MFKWIRRMLGIKKVRRCCTCKKPIKGEQGFASSFGKSFHLGCEPTKQ